MPIESILYIGIGFLFVVLICLALQTVVKQTTNLLVGKKKDAITRLEIEFDELKIEVNLLKTKLEVISTKMTEHADPIPVSPTTGQVTREDTWSRDEPVSYTSIIPTAGQLTPDDTWTRDGSESKPVEESTSTPRLTAAQSPGHANSELVGMRTDLQRGRTLKARSSAISTRAARKDDLGRKSPTASV